MIDDRLYNEILEQQKDKAKYHLTNIVKANDLVTSTTEGHYTVILLCLLKLISAVGITKAVLEGTFFSFY